MKKATILVCVLFIAANAFGASTNFMVNLASAKQKAGVEGKLYMVHFTANWCTPCKWMNSHTFTDDRVVDYLSQNYVPVKIDVENFDGIIIKQKNNIQFLPTILIFNSTGEEVGRFEEAIGPSKLMAILEENNIPNNKVKIALPEPMEAEQPSSISRPLLPSIFDDSVESGRIDTELASPVIHEEDIVSNTNSYNTNIPVYTPPTNETINNDVELVTPPSKVEDVVSTTIAETPYEEPATIESPVDDSSLESTHSAAEESLAFLTGEGIFELEVKYKSKQGYSVQIGLYARYENVLAEVHKFKNMYQQDVYVHIGKMNGSPVYRLLMGSYSNKSDADRLEYKLKHKGLDCFVSDLSKL